MCFYRSSNAQNGKNGTAIRQRTFRYSSYYWDILWPIWVIHDFLVRKCMRENHGKVFFSNIQLILAKILRPIWCYKKITIARKDTNFAPNFTIFQPISGICSGNFLLKPIWLWIAWMFARPSYKFPEAYSNPIEFISFHRAWDWIVTRIWHLVIRISCPTAHLNMLWFG